MLPHQRNNVLVVGPGPRPRSPPRGGPTAIRRRPGPDHRLAAARRAVFAFTALGLVARASAVATLPYTPTTILLPPDGGPGGGTAYIFAPGDKPNAVDFLTLDVSALRTSALEPTKLTSTLPFLSETADDCTTFAPSLLRNGTIAVLAGACTAGSTSTLWTFTPNPDNNNHDAQWTQHLLTPSPSWDNAQSGPYHLGGMLSFSAQLSPTLSPPTLYLYGGMCPSSSSSDEASYSNRMLRLTPSPAPPPGPNQNQNPPQTYTLAYTPPKGQQPPVAAAGFTLTELTPSISNLTRGGGGEGMVTQHTTHVLLGGHTQRAFVNMSTAAVWSLPEETWSFVGIAPPSSSSPSGDGGDGGGGPDLTRQRHSRRQHRRDGTGGGGVDSRSGHTAVLSEDGTRLVVYGGWVGDVGQRAEPQLAVVRLGAGLGDWAWEVPALDGPEGAGVYGHGAVVLPGNVMMVYGGYGIVDGGMKRREVKGNMFYNITSMSWSDEYVMPAGAGAGGSNGSGGSAGGGRGNGWNGQDGSSGPAEDTSDSSRTMKIGLGVGLGVGLLFLGALAALAIRWFRRRQRRRAARDETLRGLSQGVNGSPPRGLGDDDDDDDGEMLERDHGMGMFPWTAAAAREWYTGGEDPYTQGQRSLGYETLRSGSKSGPSLYIPPPPSASSFSNRPKGAKGLYQPATGPSYDFTPLTPSRNRIEPIYEADEDEEGDLGKGYPLSPDKEDDDTDDPFLTPTQHSPVRGLFPDAHSQQPQSQPQNGQEQHPDVQDWVSDCDAAAAPTQRRRRSNSNSNSNSQPKSPAATSFPATAASSSSSSSAATATAAGAVTATGTGRVSPLRRGASTKSAQSAAGRHSLVSAPTDSSASGADDGRTDSNLSERSAFSFVRGSGATAAGGSGSGGGSNGGGGGPEDRVLLSRLRSTLATTTTPTPTITTSPTTATATGTTTTTTTANERLNTSGSGGSGSSASGNSYNTARSNFAALQAEGPSLLMGGEHGGDEYEHEYEYEYDDDDNAEYDYVYVPPAAGSPSKSKPRRRSWLGSLKRVFSGSGGAPEGVGGDSSPTREGLLVYEAGGGSSDYDGAAYGGGLTGLQRRRTGGREAWLGGNWDEEDRDLERAAAQEPLRVVNAEVEREESVLIVDPDEEEDEEEEDGRPADDKTLSVTGEGGPAQPPELEPSLHRLEPALLSPSPPPRLVLPAEDNDRAADRPSTATLEPPLTGISPSPSRSPSLRASSITSTTLHTAEAVRLERPRTRVLAMVESLETRSREGSPSSSLGRGS